MSGNTTKIVFLGAGSISFGMSMLRDLVTTRELRGSTLTLVTQHADSAAVPRSWLAISVTGQRPISTSRQRPTGALPWTAHRSSSIQQRSNATGSGNWISNFKKFGIRQTLGENGGAGGLFFTLRTLPMIFDFVRDMEELCPEALLINFSNPESRIVMALGRYSKIRCIGLCHGINGSRWQVAEIMGLPTEDVDVWGAGLNHFQCLVQIRHRKTGEDLYPRLKTAEASFRFADIPADAPPVSRLRLLANMRRRTSRRVFFLWLGSRREGVRLRRRRALARRIRAQRQPSLAGSADMPGWWIEPSGERGGAVIAAELLNQKRILDFGIVYNQGAIPNLPGNLAVEVPVMVDAAGVHPISLGPLPDPIAKLMSMQASVQQLSVDAAVHASKETALQALLIDPAVNSVAAAEKLLDELWGDQSSLHSQMPMTDADPILLGDIGGTNARFAILNRGMIGPVARIKVAGCSGVIEAIRGYLGQPTRQVPVRTAVLGLAGTVENNRCVMTNSGWIVDALMLQDAFDFRQIRLFNDFEALAWSLPDLDAADMFSLGGGPALPRAPILLIGPGTGFGTSCLLTRNGLPVVITSEASHSTLPGTSQREDAVIDQLRKRFGHVSIERRCPAPDW